MSLGYIMSFILLLGLIQPAQANGLMLDRIVCEAAVFKTLSIWGESYDWHPDTVDGDQRSVKSPTKTIGKWVKLITDNKSSTLIKYTAAESITIQYNIPDCSPKMTTKYKKINRHGFNDRKLSSILDTSSKSKRAGIIYTWSPFMNFSIDGIAEARSIAKSLNLEFHLLYDSKVKNRGNTDSIKLNSLELKERGAEIHYPSLFFYKNGEIDSIARPGYDSPDRLRSYLKKRMEGN